MILNYTYLYQFQSSPHNTVLLFLKAMSLMFNTFSWRWAQFWNVWKNDSQNEHTLITACSFNSSILSWCVPRNPFLRKYSKITWYQMRRVRWVAQQRKLSESNSSMVLLDLCTGALFWWNRIFSISAGLFFHMALMKSIFMTSPW